MSEVLVVAEEEAVVDGVQVETVEGWAEVVAVAVERFLTVRFPFHKVFRFVS